MNTKDIEDILKLHKDIESVVLEKSKNYSDIWEDFVRLVYYNNQLETTKIKEEQTWDYVLRDSLDAFHESDSLDVVNKKGKLLKRFAKFFKESNGYVIPDNIMGIMGDLLQSLANKENFLEFHIDFTQNFDWSDGNFGKCGSCWWGQYSDSLPTFQDNGGWCLRFYDAENNGIGRTWLFPKNGVLLGFNSYGIERAKVSKIIKKIFDSHGIELHYSSCRIYNDYSDTIPYINGDSGFVLYVDENSRNSEYDLDMEVVKDENHEICYNCDGRIDVDNGDYSIVGDNIYCDDCVNDLFSYCDKCEEYCDKDDVHEISNKYNKYDYVCKYCASSIGLTLCDGCCEYSETCVKMYDTNNILCDNCNNSFFCEKCENYFENSSGCPDCEDDEEENEEIEQVTDLKHKFDGLITSVDSVDFVGEIKEVNTYKFPNIPGLMVCKNNDWMVYHNNTKLSAMSGIRTFYYAIDAMIKFGELANWSNETQETINNNKELRESAIEVQKYIRRNMEA